jgi:hypothetical protein
MWVPARLARLALPILATFVLVACDEPPNREVSAADNALALARQAGADRYAAERYHEAETALGEARRKIEQKDYRGALSSATDAAEKARSAAQQASAAKTVGRSTAEVAVAEVHASLDEIAAIREEATADKVPDKVFEDLAPLVDEVQQALLAAARSLEAGEILEAQKAATDVKARVAPLPGRFREALDAWQAAHPKRGARPPVKK